MTLAVPILILPVSASTDIDLHNVIPEEPEDCDLVDGKILLTINGGTGYYIITHQKNNE